MKILILGDIHDKWDKTIKIINHEYPNGKGTILCTGDLVTYPSIENNKFYFVYDNVIFLYSMLFVYGIFKED